jgi:hypothetical protein
MLNFRRLGPLFPRWVSELGTDAVPSDADWSFDAVRLPDVDWAVDAPWSTDVDVPFEADLFFCFWSSRRLRASASRLSSRVSKAAHVLAMNARNSAPSLTVISSRMRSVLSVWVRSFAKPCQCAQVNRSRRIELLWGSGSRPSKTGIIH